MVQCDRHVAAGRSAAETQADSAGRLAQDAGGFAAVVAAFQSKDPDAFRWVLDRLGFLPDCDLLCEWVRIKMGVLRCIEICGDIPVTAQTPDLKQFAGAVVKLASNEALLRRIVGAVSCGDADDYRIALARRMHSNTASPTRTIAA